MSAVVRFDAATYILFVGKWGCMSKNRNLLMLPGDGIGPEAMREVRRVIDWLDRRRSISFEIDVGLVGGASYEAHGTPLTDETLEKAMQTDAVLFGAVGGPQCDSFKCSDAGIESGNRGACGRSGRVAAA